MKSVMLSIQPKWCELIESGKKTIEVRKTRPKLETPFKCYIYETKAKDHYAVFHKNTIGKVIGEINCYGIIKYDYNSDGYGIREEDRLCYLSCLTPKELYHYLQGDKCYGWCFDNLVIYDEPKELCEFHLPCNSECDGCCEYGCVRLLKRPPQSWCYVEELR